MGLEMRTAETCEPCHIASWCRRDKGGLAWLSRLKMILKSNHESMPVASQRFSGMLRNIAWIQNVVVCGPGWMEAAVASFTWQSHHREGRIGRRMVDLGCKSVELVRSSSWQQL